MILKVVLLALIGLSYAEDGSTMSYDTIIVGLGAAGTTAASTLARAGRRVLALEAQNRIGGRVYSVPFGDGIVELGAEWIHGTESSRVYDLAIQNNVSIVEQELTFEVYNSDGSHGDKDIFNELMYYALEVSEDPPKKPEPLGQYITRRVKEYIKEKHPDRFNDTDFVNGMLGFMDLMIDNIEASNSWNDVTTDSRFQELGGIQHMSWQRNSYHTLFDILLNTYNHGPGLTNLTIKLNIEVTNIEWSQDPSKKVVVTTKDGTKYTADNVIVTVSIGVLKERYTTLFTPQLPEEKVIAIENTSIGIVDKIVFSFPDAWWPKTSTFFGFFWKKEDKKLFSGDDAWLTKIFGVTSPMGSDKALTVWTSGNDAKLVETLPDDVVKRKVMGLLRRFMGRNMTIPEPKAIIRSNWYSNPYTRGSYTYDNLLTPQYPTARVDLGKPLVDASGSPRVLFAGEATDPIHFSTVHGASDSGYREAMRLLPTNKL